MQVMVKSPAGQVAWLALCVHAQRHGVGIGGVLPANDRQRARGGVAVQPLIGVERTAHGGGKPALRIRQPPRPSLGGQHGTQQNPPTDQQQHEATPSVKRVLAAVRPRSSERAIRTGTSKETVTK